MIIPKVQLVVWCMIHIKKTSGWNFNTVAIKSIAPPVFFPLKKSVASANYLITIVAIFTLILGI